MPQGQVSTLRADAGSYHTLHTFVNHTFEEIEVGSALSVSHRLTKMEVDTLAFVSGETDFFQLDVGTSKSKQMMAEAVAGVSLLSALLKRRLPGPGTQIIAEDLKFVGTLEAGDEVVGTVTAKEKRPTGNVIVFDCLLTRYGERIISGTVTVAAPQDRIRYNNVATPTVILRRNDSFAKVLKLCEGRPPVSCAVVYPCDRDSLLGPLEAAERGLIIPILVGPEREIRDVAEAEGVDLSPCRIVAAERDDSAQRAVALARAGEVQCLMKGSLHTDELMAAVVPSATGLRTGRRISHVFVLDVPAYPRLLLVTDAAINICPSAKEKMDIAQNAIDLAHALGIEKPRVAVLAAIETVNPEMQATVDAAMLCKMAERGQIVGGILDGPLAFDNAVSEEAAHIKKIASPVAGRADILLVPDLEAGNILAKQLLYLAGAESAGLVLGTRVPIVLTSRADSVRSRLVSVAVMKLVVQIAHGPISMQNGEFAHAA
jgi:phosphotransacetylase